MSMTMTMLMLLLLLSACCRSMRPCQLISAPANRPPRVSAIASILNMFQSLTLKCTDRGNDQNDARRCDSVCRRLSISAHIRGCQVSLRPAYFSSTVLVSLRIVNAQLPSTKINDRIVVSTHPLCLLPAFHALKPKERPCDAMASAKPRKFTNAATIAPSASTNAPCSPSCSASSLYPNPNSCRRCVQQWQTGLASQLRQRREGEQGQHRFHRSCEDWNWGPNRQEVGWWCRG